MNNEMTTDNMSNEEVIEVLKGIVFGGFDRTTRKERQALDLAIKALEERPQGEWITYDVDITPHPLHCKNCGWSNHHIKNEYIKEFKVCPDCGARMGGEEK